MRKKVRKDIELWNIKFPLDYWWRKKYNIPFNSSKHRNQGVMDIIMEYEEDRMYEEVFAIPNQEKEEDKYVPNSGNLWHPAKEISQDISDDEFDNIDFNELNNGR